MKNVLIGVILILAGAAGAFAYPRATRTPATQLGGSAVPGACADHGVPGEDCPWCDPSLIETKGECPEHGVPEALCSRCNPALIAGFKAAGDWCADHAVPESQCALCKAGQLPPGEAEATKRREMGY